MDSNNDFADMFQGDFRQYEQELAKVKTNNTPIAVDASTTLHSRAKRVYGAMYTIITMFRRSNISREEISKRTGENIKTIQRGVNELVETGWIFRATYRDNQGHLRNVYKLNMKKLMDEQEKLLSKKNP